MENPNSDYSLEEFLYGAHFFEGVLATLERRPHNTPWTYEELPSYVRSRLSRHRSNSLCTVAIDCVLAWRGDRFCIFDIEKAMRQRLNRQTSSSGQDGRASRTSVYQIAHRAIVELARAGLVIRVPGDIRKRRLDEPRHYYKINW